MLASNTRSHQTAGGHIFHTPGSTTGTGASKNQLFYGDAKGNTYWRAVNVANNIITYDREGGNLAHDQNDLWGVPTADTQEVADLGDTFRLPGNQHGE